MKCLLIKPPFAQYIVQGVKPHEWRKRPTKIRGRIGIVECAPLKPIDKGTREIIGDVELWYCSTRNEDGSYCWELRNARRYKNPVTILFPHGAQTWINVDFTPPSELYPELSQKERCILERERIINEHEYLKKYLLKEVEQ